MYVTPLCFVSGYGVSEQPAGPEPFHIHLFGTFKEAGTVIKPATDPAFVGLVDSRNESRFSP